MRQTTFVACVVVAFLACLSTVSAGEDADRGSFTLKIRDPGRARLARIGVETGCFVPFRCVSHNIRDLPPFGEDIFKLKQRLQGITRET